MGILSRIKEWLFPAAAADRRRPMEAGERSDDGGDYPIPFYDISWLAVKTTEADVIMDVLGLSDPLAVTWRQGLSAVCGDYWDFAAPLEAVLSRVYITPAVDGWRLAVGGWVGEGGGEGFERVVQYCRELSRRCGEAHAFTSQGRMAWYSWVLARDGSVYRKYFFHGDEVKEEGTPTPAEQSHAGPFGENLVMAIAGECSVSPVRLCRETQCTGPGLLVITSWGREHGVPERPLD